MGPRGTTPTDLSDLPQERDARRRFTRRRNGRPPASRMPRPLANIVLPPTSGWKRRVFSLSRKTDGASSTAATNCWVGCVRRARSARFLRAQMEEIVAAALEREMLARGENEVSSSFVGEKLMEALKALDPVAYIRFASVYRSFRDIESFRRRTGGAACQMTRADGRTSRSSACPRLDGLPLPEYMSDMLPAPICGPRSRNPSFSRPARARWCRPASRSRFRPDTRRRCAPAAA